MELLIPGLALVALMIYASTRIKRTAADAFESEKIETADFCIDKPEGFLHVLQGDPQYLFEAYSRDFSTKGRRDIRLVNIKMRLSRAKKLNAAVKRLADDGNEIAADTPEVIGDHRYRLIEATSRRGGVDYRKIFKLGQAGERLFELEAAVLDEAPEDIVKKVELMVASFRLK